MKTKFKYRRDYKLKERGVAAVEFAIVISLLVLITGGIIEFGRVLWYLDALTKATRDGARFMSTVPKNTILSNITAAQNLVVNAANAANVSPVLTGGNVEINCTYLDSGGTEGGWGSCHNDVPVHLRVAITSYNVAFGSWFPIPLPAGDWFLTPHTTMRYMCDAGATTPC